MTADESLFSDQLDALPNLRVIPWITPHARETLSAYARRISSAIDLHEPCFVGGASFGGVVALEMARHVPAVACILIGSIRSPQELPTRLKWLRVVTVFGPNFLRAVAWTGLHVGKWFLSSRQLHGLRSLASDQSTFERWAICALINWKQTSGVKHIPVFQIHGSSDGVFPVSLTHPDEIVPDGDHALSLSHPGEVTEFISHVVQGMGHGRF